MGFLARLAALIAPPLFHLTRFYGVFAAASHMRAQVVPKTPPPRRRSVCPRAPQCPKRMADLLRRVFLAGVRRCDCGGSLRIVAAILNPDATEAIAAALLLSAPRDSPTG